MYVAPEPYDSHALFSSEITVRTDVTKVEDDDHGSKAFVVGKYCFAICCVDQGDVVRVVGLSLSADLVVTDCRFEWRYSCECQFDRALFLSLVLAVSQQAAVIGWSVSLERLRPRGSYSLECDQIRIGCCSYPPTRRGYPTTGGDHRSSLCVHVAGSRAQSTTVPPLTSLCASCAGTPLCLFLSVSSLYLSVCVLL